MRQGVLFAAAFDAQRLEYRGQEVAMLDNVGQALISGHSADLTAPGSLSSQQRGRSRTCPCGA